MEEKILTEYDREVIDKEFERKEKFCNGLEEILRINREIRANLEESIKILKANKPPKWDFTEVE